MMESVLPYRRPDSPMRYLRAVLLCSLLLGVMTGGAIVGAGEFDDDDEVQFILEMQSTGDAEWTIVTRIPLADEEAIDAFAETSSSFESGDIDYRQSISTFERAARDTSATVDRDMGIENTSRSSRIIEDTDNTNPEYDAMGELILTFTWYNFAREENGTIYVDDAFSTPDGTWFPGLAEGQSLIIQPPSGYGSPATAPVPPQDGELRWEGPTTFPEEYFVIVYEPGIDTPPTETGGLDAATLLLLGAILLSLIALTLAVYLLLRRQDRLPEFGQSDQEISQDTLQDPNSISNETDVDHTEPASGPNMDLLSDEERVEYLLEEHGGRMKQAAIVDETDWSNAKVSQLLSAMAEEGRVNKLRIGRENLISLPDEDIGDLSTDE